MFPFFRCGMLRLCSDVVTLARVLGSNFQRDLRGFGSLGCTHQTAKRTLRELEDAGVELGVGPSGVSWLKTRIPRRRV